MQCSRVSEGQLVPRENCTELPQKLRRSTNCAEIGGQIAGFAEREGVAGFAEILQRNLQLRLQNLRFVVSVLLTTLPARRGGGGVQL